MIWYPAGAEFQMRYSSLKTSLYSNYYSFVLKTVRATVALTSPSELDAKHV